MNNLTTVEEVVVDIIDNMSEAEKTKVIHTAEKDLIAFHHGWGRQIRNQYKLWQNTELVKATGTAHPDDASGIIMKSVWKALREGK